MRYRLLLALLLLLLPGVACAQTRWQISNLNVGTNNPAIPGVINIGPWVAGSYLFGDTVSFGIPPALVIAGKDTSAAPDASGDWNSLAGVGVWSPAGTYVLGQPVIYKGSLLFANFNNSGSSGTPALPTWSVTGVPVVASTTGNALTGAAIQAAINATPAGGIVQLGCGTYPVSSTITINKALTLQGCGPAGMKGVGGTGTILTSSGTAITVSTVFAVVIRDLAISLGAGGRGVFITCDSTSTPSDPNCTGLPENTVNDRSIIERVWVSGGDFGVDGELEKSRATTIYASYFSGQAQAGVRFRGTNNGGGQNCDSGGYTLIDNQFGGPGAGVATANAMRFENSSAVTLVGNQAIAYASHGVLFTSAACVGTNVSQIQIIGNQFETGHFGLSALKFVGLFQNIHIGQNYLSAKGGPALSLSGSPPGGSFFATITGNTLRIFSGSSQPGLSIDGWSGVSVIGNTFNMGQGVTANDAAILTNMTVVSITGNNLIFGGTATNGFTTSGSSFCSSGNSFLNITNKFNGPSTDGC